MGKRYYIGVHTPNSLFRAVFYYNGKVFCLRGGNEHRFLKPSQFTRLTNPDRYIYIQRMVLKIEMVAFEISVLRTRLFLFLLHRVIDVM